MRKGVFVCVRYKNMSMAARSNTDWQQIGSLSHHSGFYQYFLAIPGVRKIKKQLSNHAATRKANCVTIITKSHIWGFWQDNKQANWKREEERNCHNGGKKEDIVSDLQSLYSTVWLSRNKLRELNQCDRVNDCFCLLNAVWGAAGPQGPQVTLRLPVIST